MDNNKNKLLSSSEIWDMLCVANESHTFQTVTMRLRALFATHADNDSDITKHLSDVQNQQSALANTGQQWEDDLFNTILIATLPKSWDNFTSSFMGVQGGNKRGSISTMQLISMLKSEYIRRVGDDKIRGDQTYRANVDSRPSKRKRDGGTCTICNYDNHTTDDCRWKRDGGYCTQCRRGGHWTSNCWGKNGKGKGKRLSVTSM